MFEKVLGQGDRRRGYHMGGTTTASVVLHGSIVAGMIYASLLAPELVSEEAEEDVEFIEIVETEPPPPPETTEAAPPPPPPDAFQELSVPTVVPPELPALDFGPAVNAQDFSGLGPRTAIAANNDSVPTVDPTTPTFTPYEVAPEVRNVEAVRSALTREYPAVLRDAGIGGTVIMWFFINDQGVVENVQVNTSSGFEQLDAAALAVADVFEFTPAINQNEQVAVWISIPITFQTTQ
jgi:protein TonB